MAKRLDVAIFELGLAPTRTKAQELIKNRCVMVDGVVVEKCGYDIDSQTIEIIGNDTLKYVSRAGLKLERAIDAFSIDTKDKTILDIGSSTGGFCDCALKNGAKHVVACDVGTDVMDKILRKNPKIDLHEQTNILSLDGKYFISADLITIDVSFISLKTIFAKIAKEKASADVMALIKPQFECGKEIAKKFKGVITDKNIHLNVIKNVIGFANENGLFLQGLEVSPIKGGDGNVEFLSLFSSKIKQNNIIDLKSVVEK